MAESDSNQRQPPNVEEVITPEVLRSVVNGYYDDDLGSEMKILSFDAQLATASGDNYLSILYATDIHLEDSKTGRNETIQVMLKTIPKAGGTQEWVGDLGVFRKEANIYRNVIPFLTRVQDDLGLPSGLKVAPWPKCYAAHVDGKTDYLAMEDLKLSCYKMGDRVNGCDFNHCALVLRTLARYHAVSYAKFGGSREKILELFPDIGSGIFNTGTKSDESMAQFREQSLKSQYDQLKNAGEPLAASRIDKLLKLDLSELLGNLLIKGVEVNVIIHGDFWVNNMLFKYDGSFPTHVKFLDFQLTMVSSRFIDIFYFLLTSADLDVLDKHERDFLMIYYAEFTSHANILGVDTQKRGLDWEAFMKESEQFRMYGTCMGLLMAPIVSAITEDLSDFQEISKEEMEDPEEAMKDFYKNMGNKKSMEKAKRILLNYLPKCPEAEAFL